MKQKKAKMGRPAFPAGKACTKPVLVRLTPALHKAMSLAAKQAGKTLTGWIRDAAIERLNRE